MFGYGRYLAFKEESAKLPSIQVSREEFIRLSIEAGVPEKKAESNAIIAGGLGASIRIGEQMVGIKEEKE